MVQNFIMSKDKGIPKKGKTLAWKNYLWKSLATTFGLLEHLGVKVHPHKEANPFLLQSRGGWVGEWVVSFPHPSKAKWSMKTLLWPPKSKPHINEIDIVTHS